MWDFPKDTPKWFADGIPWDTFGEGKPPMVYDPPQLGFVKGDGVRFNTHPIGSMGPMGIYTNTNACGFPKIGVPPKHPKIVMFIRKTHVVG